MMGKTIVVFLAFAIFVSHCYVMKDKDNKPDLKREKRSCHDCDEFGPYGPPPPPPGHGHPPPPPFFRTQNWSGLTRSDDGFHQGVFSGAAASAGLESDNTEQAFSIASSNTGAGTEGQTSNCETQSEDENGVGANSQSSAGFSGQQNEDLPGTDKKFQYSYQSGKHFGENGEFSGGQKLGGQQHVPGSSGSQQQVQEQAFDVGAGIGVVDYGDHSTGFSGQSGANSQTIPNAGNNAALGRESGASLKDQQNGISSNYKESQYAYQGFLGNAKSAGGKGSDGQQELKDGFESKQQMQGSFRGQQKNENRFESHDKSSGSQSASSQASFGAMLPGYSQPTNNGGDDQSVNSGGQNQIGSGFETSEGSNSQKSSGIGALKGALDLASQGLQTSQQSGASSCSTCGKGSYAFSNANSHSGNAVAVSIG